MTTLIFDLEADNFYPALTKIHCIVTEDYDTGEIEAYYENEKQIYQGLLSLYNADKIVGHNIIGFDIPAIKKLYPRWKYKSLDDTFLLSCILNPLRLAHSIESYSNGTKVANEDWTCLTHNMLDRCVIDTHVGTKIYRDFRKVLDSTDDYDDTIDLEYRTAINHLRQLDAGVDVDVPLVMSTLECLDAELEALSGCIKDRLPYRCIHDKSNYKKIFNKDGSLNHHILTYFKGEAEALNDYSKINKPTRDLLSGCVSF